jgi:aminoglycoside phosphotransferase (APT) family kinase protein
LPEGDALCHGDFHPENVIFTARGPVIIDWSTATRGHPLGDLACTSRLFRTASLPPWAPLHAHLLLKMFRPLSQQTYVNRYLQLHGGDRRDLARWEAALSAAAVGWRTTSNAKLV